MSIELGLFTFEMDLSYVFPIWQFVLPESAAGELVLVEISVALAF